MMVCQTTGEILSTINDLLQVATIESGRWCMENVAFQPRKLLDLILRLLSRGIGEKNLTFDHDVDESLQATVAGDVSRLRQLLLTIHEVLIDEARHAERIAVTVRVLGAEDPLLAQMPRSKRFVACAFDLALVRKGRFVLEPLELGHESDPRLVLASELTSCLGGRLMHCASVGAFRLVVHFKKTTDDPHAPSQRYSVSRDPVGKSRRFTILIFEGNPIFLKAFCKNLALRGHAVDIVREISEIVAMAEAGSLHRTYDCVLIDMSDAAFDLVRSLRVTERRTGIKRLPVLVSITHGTEGWERRHLDASIDGHFMKPCSEDVILSRISDAISAVNALVSIHEDSASQGSSVESVRTGNRSNEAPLRSPPDKTH